MNTKLDSFETALLTELRREVAGHPSPVAAPAPGRHPRRRLKLTVAGVVTTAAATVAAVGLTPGSSPTVSPAFAVEANADGSVDLAVLRLDDADGLEAALAEHGIDATVHFMPMADGQMPQEPEVDGPWAHGKPGPDNPCGIDNGPGPASLVPASVLGKTDTMPTGTEFEGAEYVLQVPADSPLFRGAVIFDVGSPGSFAIAYESAIVGKYCFFGQSQMFEVPPSGEGTVHFG